MRSSTRLAKLDLVASRRLSRLRAMADVAIKPRTIDTATDKAIAYVVIEAVNLWANFSRAYALSCPFGVISRAGARISLSNAAITTPGDVLLAAARAAKGPSAVAPTDRRSEPDWKDRSLLLKTCNAMGVSNFGNVQAALSVNSRVFEDLPPFRNFYAHRNDETAEKAVRIGRTQYMIMGKKHPSEVLSSAAHKRTQPLLLDWLDDMGVVVSLLCD